MTQTQPHTLRSPPSFAIKATVSNEQIFWNRALHGHNAERKARISTLNYTSVAKSLDPCHSIILAVTQSWYPFIIANGIMKNHSRKHHQTISDAIMSHEKRFNHLTALFVAHCIFRWFTVLISCRHKLDGFGAKFKMSPDKKPNHRGGRFEKNPTHVTRRTKLPLSIWPNEVIWVFPKIGGKPPKWMVKIMESLIKWMIWDVFALFFGNTHISPTNRFP